MSSTEGSPCPCPMPQRVRCSSDGSEHEAPCSPERPERMRDWIIRMVDSKRFPGLEWLDIAPDCPKTVFRVPWIHAKKRGYNRERDAALFREWALHTGKLNTDPTNWKINFRCAINGLKDISEIKDMQTEDCRVYRVLPSRTKRRRPRRPRPEPYSVPSCYPHAEINQIFNPVGSHYHRGCSPPVYSPQPLVPVSTSLYPTAMKAGDRHRSACIYALPPSSYTDVASRADIVVSSSSGLDGLRALPTACISSTGQPLSGAHITELEPPSSAGYYEALGPLPPVSSIQPGMAEMSPLAMTRHGSPDSGIDAQSSPLSHQQPYVPCSISSCDISLPLCPTSVGSTAMHSHDSEIVDLVEELEKTHSPTPSLPSSPSPYDIEVQVYYGSIQVCSRRLLCHNGCRILHDPRYVQPPLALEAEKVRELFGPLEAQHVQLPQAHPDVQANTIFQALTRGLLIELEDDDIYATPLCRTVVYSGSASDGQSYPLEREQRTKVFDYKNSFHPQLEQYALMPGGRIPAPHVMFSLGQSWGPSRHVSQNLVSVVVTHLSAKHELDSVGIPTSLMQDLLVCSPGSVEIDQASPNDLEAERFLSQALSQVISTVN